MKYMGHKGKMLPFLWEILRKRLDGVSTIADPFCGSGAVSWFLATRVPIRVISGDLQLFAAIRSAAVVERTKVVADFNLKLSKWFDLARHEVESLIESFPLARDSLDLSEGSRSEMILYVQRSRRFCSQIFPKIVSDCSIDFCMTRSYGGYYYSPIQAIIFDALRQTVPTEPKLKNVFIAALIDAASKCAAAPGHTAQPFQPTFSAIDYIKESWNRDVWESVRVAAERINNVCALTQGKVVNSDFHECLEYLNAGDIVFADPPYSDVQYSRFYHVLETLARGWSTSVSGVGRYPALCHRPISQFSRRSSSLSAATDLVKSCADKRLQLVITFPTYRSSNGLCANEFKEIASRFYANIDEYFFESEFSTLGGNGLNRSGRKASKESILCMTF